MLAICTYLVPIKSKEKSSKAAVTERLWSLRERVSVSIRCPGKRCVLNPNPLQKKRCIRKREQDCKPGQAEGERHQGDLQENDQIVRMAHEPIGAAAYERSTRYDHHSRSPTATKARDYPIPHAL